MEAPNKKSIAGILVDAVDYRATVDFILQCARTRRGAAVSATAVHSIMEGIRDPVQKYRLNQFDLLVPDGQPVRWALNLLYRTRLSDRVYGPNLMLKTCERAASEGQPVFLYGATPEIIRSLVSRLQARFPLLAIAGAKPSRFRRLTEPEYDELAREIVASGASILFVGLGCPRQEIFAFEFRNRLSMPIVAVGGAFAIHAGHLSQAPQWMGDRGLEWLYRLLVEPRRLWHRYLVLSPAYIFAIAAQACGIGRFLPEGIPPIAKERFG